MYVISKLFTAFILPPGGFILLLVAAFLFFKRYKLVFLSLAILLYLSSTPFLTRPLLLSLEHPFIKAPLNVKADAVIVLGGGVYQGQERLPLGSDAFKRAMHGLMVAKTNNLPLFYSGGGPKKMSEGEGFEIAMKTLSGGLGVEIPKIQTLHEGFGIMSEGKSLDTYENAKFTLEKLKEQGIKNPTIVLVTSAYHMKRSLALYNHFGFTVIPSATDFKLDYPAVETWRNYLPSMGSFMAGYIALHEYAGLFSLKLRGL